MYRGFALWVNVDRRWGVDRILKETLSMHFLVLKMEYSLGMHGIVPPVHQQRIVFPDDVQLRIVWLLQD